MKSCETSTPVLPAIGTRVVITDGDRTGWVGGHGFITGEGQLASPGFTAPAMPVALVWLHYGFWANPTLRDCWVNMLVVHADNLTTLEV